MGYRKYKPCDNVQNRAMRYFLGVHRFVPLLAINGDVGWLVANYISQMAEYNTILE